MKGSYNVINLWDGHSINAAIQLIRDGKANGINFNFTRNFPSNIDEIKSAQQIKYIQINDYSWDFDYSAIDHLDKLEELSIYTTDKREINFDHFPNLKTAAIFWRPKANSLFNCVGLEHLFLGKYSDTDLSKLSGLTNLKYLRINTGSIRNLKGIENLEKLETLMLMQATKLEDLSGIELLTNLTRLRIDNCRNIKNIELLKNLDNVKALEIMGTTPRLN